MRIFNLGQLDRMLITETPTKVTKTTIRKNNDQIEIEVVSQNIFQKAISHFKKNPWVDRTVTYIDKKNFSGENGLQRFISALTINDQIKELFNKEGESFCGEVAKFLSPTTLQRAHEVLPRPLPPHNIEQTNSNKIFEPATPPLPQNRASQQAPNFLKFSENFSKYTEQVKSRIIHNLRTAASNPEITPAQRATIKVYLLFFSDMNISSLSEEEKIELKKITMALVNFYFVDYGNIPGVDIVKRMHEVEECLKRNNAYYIFNECLAELDIPDTHRE